MDVNGRKQRERLDEHLIRVYLRPFAVEKLPLELGVASVPRFIVAFRSAKDALLSRERKATIKRRLSKGDYQKATIKRTAVQSTTKERKGRKELGGRLPPTVRNFLFAFFAAAAFCKEILDAESKPHPLEFAKNLKKIKVSDQTHKLSCHGVAFLLQTNLFRERLPFFVLPSGNIEQWVTQ